MKGSITQLATGLAVAALIALPASVAAQTPPSQPPATQTPATGSSQSAEATQDQASREAAREHLAKAKAALADVNTSTVSARAKAELTELNRRMNALERAVAANDNASATGEANRSTRATAGTRGNTEWGTELGAIDKTLTALIGPQSPNATGTPAAVGTSGTATSPSAAAVDETTRAKLMQVRSHLTAFATAMAGGDPKTPAPSTDPTTDPNAAAGAPTGTSQQPTGTSGTSQTAPATGASGTQTQPASETPAAQPDEQAARRHLTEARNTLSEITQLPAASQLSGDARTQVSQLISNFNELISSQSDWRGAYAKVSAHLNALIGSESGVTTDPTVSGTTGAVGTSGTANLDPEIRSRLVVLRRQLNEFEKAAGGGTAMTPSASAAMNPPATDPNAPASTAPPTGTTPPSATPPSTTPPATPPSTTPPSSTAPAGAQSTPGMAGAQAGNAEAMRQIAAIEALLKSEDDSGGLTLTKAQLEQLRTHLAGLRQALGR